jgi:predicted ATP-dependent protease
VCIDAIPAFSSNSCSRPKFQQELSQKISTTQQKKQKTFISKLKKRKKKKQNYRAANFFFFFFFFYSIDKRKELQQITCQVPGCPRQTSA